MTGTPPLTAVIDAGNGTPFPAGASIAINVETEVPLCEAFTIVNIPTEACEVSNCTAPDINVGDDQTICLGEVQQLQQVVIPIFLFINGIQERQLEVLMLSQM